MSFLRAFPFFLFPLVWFQTDSITGQDKKHQLDELRRNIHRLQQDIAALEKNETSSMELLRKLDKQIDLTSRLKGQLRKQESAKRNQISEISARLKRTGEELVRLKEMAARRAVFFYKYGRIPDLEMLLTSRSINQVLLWARYQRLMTENDRRLLDGIRAKQEQLQAQQEKYSKELENHKQILAEKLQEEKSLRGQRTKRQAFLKNLRKDKAYYEMQLAEQEQAATRIARLIASDASAKARTDFSKLPFDGSFSSLKGTLPWPVAGRIVSHYGTFRHPVLKTVTKNLGIDIAVEAGAEVRSVASGKVIAITWQRGYGNLVMLSHSDGFYTVYTHLADVLVSYDDTVIAGQVIGTVAENAAGGEGILHFQIWQRAQARRSQDLNPEVWLRS